MEENQERQIKYTLKSKHGYFDGWEHLGALRNTGLDTISFRASHLAPPGYPAPPGRYPRSSGPEEKASPGQGEGRVEGCIVDPSCPHQSSPASHTTGTRYSCHCDPLCTLYGDCCPHPTHHRPPQPTSTPTFPPSSLACQSLQPTTGVSGTRCEVETRTGWGCQNGDEDLPATVQDSILDYKTVLLVAKCPEGTSRPLANKCARILEAGGAHTYLMDVPVFSETSGIGYSNVYCAVCHHDTSLHNVTKHISCTTNIISTTQLASMTYHPQELMWTGVGEADKFLESSGIMGDQNIEKCILKINVSDDVVRWCERSVVTSCPDNRPEEEKHNCSSYNYYVEASGRVYKNRDCALCHGISEDAIECLGSTKEWPIFRLAPPPSLMDLFVVDGDCKDNQVWDALFRRCEDVFCGSLFTLQEGRCVRNNDTVEDDGQSYLNKSCYTSDYKTNFSVMFPNKSVYLNHTQLMYDFGEYEFNKSWIRVCRPDGKWTPIMNIISAVLISISLVCLALHMAIFFVLPKRRNIPSMNLFSLTFSLFVTEFIFVTCFHLNTSYIGCTIIAVVLYYFLSSAFLWMNVMSIDICRTFHSQTYKIKSRRVFFQYSAYAWSVPFLGAVVTSLVDQLSPSDSLITPQFGTNVCWFNNKWGLFLFFTLPSALVILANMILYGMSIFSIYKQMKSGELASSTIRKNSSEKNKGKTDKERDRFLKHNPTKRGNKQEENNSAEYDSPKCAERIRERIQKRLHAQKKQKVRLVLYCKLALTMGITWVFAFVSMHTHSIIFEYLFIVFNGLQGTFIFISFDVKRKVWEELKREVARKLNFSITSKSFSSSGSNTKSSTVAMTSQTSYKYRWSSNRRQDGSYKYSDTSQNQSEVRTSQERESSGM